MIQSLEDFMKAVRADSSAWRSKEPVWFRGEPAGGKALLPTLYREDLSRHENALLQMFRARAAGFYDAVPDRANTDQWLFWRAMLACQHASSIGAKEPTSDFTLPSKRIIQWSGC